jgi:DNA-binding transcriptional MerR regulator
VVYLHQGESISYRTMARHKDRELALKLRRNGLSYSDIKTRLNVSKSTLSLWLRDLPLTRERINELRSNSPRRIERYRETMRLKKETRLSAVFKKAQKDIGSLSKREIFIAGLFLYWGEGGKTKPYTISLTNTDPNMIRFYMLWLKELGVPLSKIKVCLHLYSDMDIHKATQFWSDILHIPKTQFRTPHIKKVDSSKVFYRGYGQGTCNIILDNRDMSEYVLQALSYIRESYK